MMTLPSVCFVVLLMLMLLSPAKADCPDTLYNCVSYKEPGKTIGGVCAGNCMRWSPPGCNICHYPTTVKLCNDLYPACEFSCTLKPAGVKCKQKSMSVSRKMQQALSGTHETSTGGFA
jgi:hypothetical protein